ncbi:PhoX family phosphatase [Variovorax sp. dw_308]|uniref:PhoX family protein n=1 Tax=Variovorax sp. dw_308 TaxID=2721546 RepID=UPI001C451F85|nr:alkaline phosphatase PhoX [Variovorax sp. dw_308]
MTHPTETYSHVDPDDLDNNPSANTALHELIATRMHRRHVLRGGVGALAAATLGPLALSACGGGGSKGFPILPAAPAPAPSPAPAPTPAPAPAAGPTLGFNAVGKSLADTLVVPAGYTATVIYATGDSIDPAVGDYRNDGTDADFARRSGDQHDGMHFFGLTPDGKPSVSSTERALMCINHEAINGTVAFMHPNGQTNASSGARPEAEALKEVEAHGASVVELARSAGKLAVVKNTTFNRRVTPRTPMVFGGPAKGSALLKTLYSPDGTATRGMIGNCASGYTPWGTYLTCEENFAGFFTRSATDDAARSAKELTAFKRIGLKQNVTGGQRWSTVVPADATNTEYQRWNASKTGTSADGIDDFRNTHNTFGCVVEIDPYDPASTPVKHTALGRFAHEGAWPSNPVVGKPLAFYMGDDSRSEYVYKYVSKATWNAADANPADRLATGAKYLDDGTLYAAKFNADGTGTWLPLDLGNSAVSGNAAYAFADLADVLVNARLAADAAGATRCDRPEWTAVNPQNGEIYVTMTENPDRGNVGSLSSNNVPNPDVEPAFPRYWLDNKGITAQNAATQANKGDVNGQVMRIRETGNDASATTFNWDIYLFGSQARADAGLDDANYQQNVNLSGLSDFNDLSKPDGCWFSRASGILWIETDDNAYYDVTNCMLLAAVPGTYGDGGKLDVVNQANGKPGAAGTGPVTVSTYAGKKMNDTIFKRFLTAPKGSEVTGLAESPDGKALFINIQHPGENTAAADIADASKYESHWPGNGAGIAAPYGPGGATARPRSATVMITRDDGGVIGL